MVKIEPRHPFWARRADPAEAGLSQTRLLTTLVVEAHEQPELYLRAAARDLNLPRYIDSTHPEDLQNIDGHLRGGIPERDLDALGDYWQIMPALRAALFEPLRPGYARLKLPLAEVKPMIQFRCRLPSSSWFASDSAEFRLIDTSSSGGCSGVAEFGKWRRHS
jgi:hypothetical protein